MLGAALERQLKRREKERVNHHATMFFAAHRKIACENYAGIAVDEKKVSCVLERSGYSGEMFSHSSHLSFVCTYYILYFILFGAQGFIVILLIIKALGKTI